MAHSIVMPALEMAQETGKLLSWRKKEGDAIAKGEPLLDVETDKAVVEIESPAEGILAGVKAQAGDVIPVGQTIAWIVNPGEKPPVEEASSTSGRRMDSKAVPAAAAQRVLPPRRPLRLHRTPGFHRKRGGWRASMGWTSLACAGVGAKGKFWPRTFWRF